MKVIQSVDKSIEDRGIWDTILVTLSYIIDYFFDIKYGTETYSWVELEDLQIKSENIERGERYQPTHALPLRNLFRKLQIPRGKIIVDLGSGKGKVLLVAAEYGFKEARGVDFSRGLCEIAKKNILSFKKKYMGVTNFKVIQSDVTDYPIHDDEDIFYLFNPFDDIILAKVLTNMLTSLERRKRRVWIIYWNALHKNVIENSNLFKKVLEFKNLGQEFLVYSNCPK